MTSRTKRLLFLIPAQVGLVVLGAFLLHHFGVTSIGDAYAAGIGVTLVADRLGDVLSERESEAIRFWRGKAEEQLKKVAFYAQATKDYATLAEDWRKLYYSMKAARDDDRKAD